MQVSKFALLFLIVFFLLDGAAKADIRHQFLSSLNLSQEYTDNYNLNPENEKSEWLTHVSPTLKYRLLGKRSQIELNYSPKATYYLKREEETDLSHEAGLQSSLQVSKRLRFVLSDSFEYTEDPFASPRNATSEELDLTTWQRGDPYYTNTASTGLFFTPSKFTSLSLNYSNSLRRERDPYDKNNYSGNLSYRFGKKDSISLGYTHQDTESESNATRNSRKKTPTLNYSYWFTEFWGTSSNLSYTRGDFDQEFYSFDRYNGSFRLIRRFSKNLEGYILYAHTSMDYIEPIRQDFEVFKPSLGIEGSLSSRTTLNMEGGYFYREIETGRTDGGLNSNLEITHSYERGQISLSGSSGTSQSYFQTENLGFSIYYQGSIGAKYQISENVNFRCSGSYRRDRYLDEDPERTDWNVSSSAKLNYEPYDWLDLNLSETFRKQRSDDESNNYTENRIVLGITLSYGSRGYR